MISVPPNAEFHGELAGCSIQLFHPSDGFENIALICFLLFQGSGCHTEPEWFCQYECITWFQTAFTEHPAWVHKTDDHQTIFRFLVLDGMPSCGLRPRFAGFFCATADDLLKPHQACCSGSAATFSARKGFPPIAYTSLRLFAGVDAYVIGVIDHGRKNPW